MHRLVLIVALVLATAGCATQPLGGVPTSASPSSTSVLATLQVGDCTEAIELADASDLGTTDCAKTHAWEVAAVVPLSGDSYPGEDAVRQVANTECATAFADYVGVEPRFSPFGVTFLGPNQARWSDAGSRAVVCLVGTSAGGLTGSLKGSHYSFPTVGQCVGQPVAGSYALDLFACDQPHFYEVYAAKKIAGKKPPTTSEFNKLYSSVCVTGFKDFVGIAAGKSKYEILYFVVPDAEWSALKDHRLVCAAGSPSGEVSGSLQGVKK